MANSSRLFDKDGVLSYPITIAELVAVNDWTQTSRESLKDYLLKARPVVFREIIENATVEANSASDKDSGMNVVFIKSRKAFALNKDSKYYLNWGNVAVWQSVSADSFNPYENKLYVCMLEQCIYGFHPDLDDGLFRLSESPYTLGGGAYLNVLDNIENYNEEEDTIPTSAAVISYVMSKLGSMSSGMEYIGVSSSANGFVIQKGVSGAKDTIYTPQAKKGWWYKANAAGLLNGLTPIEVGDMLLCNSDASAATSSNAATINAKWDVIQGNIDGSVAGPSSSTNGNFAVFDGTTGKQIKDGGPFSASTLGFGYIAESTTITGTAKPTARKAILSTFRLLKGLGIAIRFKGDVPANATLAITYTNDSGVSTTTSAIPIYYHGEAIKAGRICAEDTAYFIYNGTYFHMVALAEYDITRSVVVKTGVTTATEDAAILSLLK